MGIDFSHCDASWSYSNFHFAREKLARVIGIDLNKMQGFGENHGPAGAKEWPSADTNALIYLLNHSDCDGGLTPEQCRLVAPALRKAVEQLPPDDWDKKKFLDLAEGMDAAAEANESLEFR